ncbi:hypothetical protein [Phaeospirillum tilakii]|uniref:Uncharacterized protein n=1 Tax=Phaeospirillum tilakii TaxID=741673 RepID=A0ABW5CFS5_9PROT
MAQYSFGSGNLILVPLASAVSTPVSFNALQDMSLDFKFDKKTLHGQKQFPLAVARGKGSIEGKFKDASVNSALFNSVFFGDVGAPGQLLAAINEAGAIPSSTAYTITVANAAAFSTDGGVRYADTGAPFTKVAAAPTAGQYSVSAAGVYTFAAADAGKGVVLSYTYTATTGGVVTTITNKDMGSAPLFKAIYTTAYQSKRLTIQLNSCMVDDLKLSAKNDDYSIPEMSFSAFADAAGNVGIVSVTE